MYGFAMCYRFTKDPAYLKQSEGIADFFLNLPNMPADGVPYWDMKMDVIKDCTPENINPTCRATLLPPHSSLRVYMNSAPT